MDIHNTINGIYNKKNGGYFSKYGIDLIIAMTIIYIFFVASMYFYVINHIPQIREKWATEKCNPLYLPFASIIMKNSDKSNSELIDNNFQACISNILSSIASEALKPIYYVTNVANKTLGNAANAQQSSRSVFNRIRTDIKETSENIYGRALNVMLPVVNQTVIMKNIVGQVQGLFTTALYVTMGTYITMYSAIMTIINIIITVSLVALTASIIAAFFIPFIGPILAAGPIALFIVVLSFLMPLIFMFGDIFSGPAVSKPHIPP
jgi:hypothetical protein